MDLREENNRIKKQEERLRMLFDQYKHDERKLALERQNLMKHKDQIRTEKKHISVQRQEFEYQKQQLERRYVKLKQDRAQLA